MIVTRASRPCLLCLKLAGFYFSRFRARAGRPCHVLRSAQLQAADLQSECMFAELLRGHFDLQTFSVMRELK